MSAQVAEILRAMLHVVRPLERLSPSAFAAKHRYLMEGRGPFSGLWSNVSPFPYLAPIMDVVGELVDEGKVGAVLMKSAQGGGTDAWGVNATLWLLVYHPGPILYLTSKDDLAKEFVRDRWDYASAKCEPLARKALTGKKNAELVQVKRYTDGKLVLTSSGSLLNLLSNAYRWVNVDEVDSVADNMPDGSNPIALLLKRLTAFREAGSTGLLAFAHPTTRERGAAHLYYDLSDQRRGHVECPHCHEWLAPLWKHIVCTAREGQSPAEAERDPTCYVFAAPCCGAVWTDGDRLVAIRTVEQRSILPPEVAAKKTWIGVHFWAFFQPSMSVLELAREYAAALDDPATMRVFWNKTLGEPYEERVADVTIEAWQALAIAEDTPRSYARGEIPAEVQWLTSGQDSREEELHWAVWGWGVVRSAEKRLLLNAWLIDWGVEDGPKRTEGRKTLEASDLFVFDQLLYERFWPRAGDSDEQLPLTQGFHDSGWQPSAAYEYCRARERRGRACPSKGAAEDDRSRAPALRRSAPPRWFVDGEEVSDPLLSRVDLNTYQLKCDFVALASARFREPSGPRPRIALPHDVSVEFLEHLVSEKLVRDRGRKRWKKRSNANHWLDCSIMAYASALNVHAAILASNPEPGTQAETEQHPRTRGEGVRSRRRRGSGGGGGRIRTRYQ